MPLIEVHVIENVFNAEQKRQMISKLTDAMVCRRCCAVHRCSF